eukprot:1145419-Pelagomonas_calceolata.AAC.1
MSTLWQQAAACNKSKTSSCTGCKALGAMKGRSVRLKGKAMGGAGCNQGQSNGGHWVRLKAYACVIVQYV